jgi:hypothetical protein
MTTISFEVLQVLIFLIPGFIAKILIDIISFKPTKQKEFDKIVSALIYSLFIYTIYAFLYGKIPIIQIIDSSKQYIDLKYDNKAFLYLIAICFLMSLIFGVVFRVLAQWNFFRRLMKVILWENVWQAVFRDKQRFITINFINGTRMYGWPEYYSDKPESQFIYLHNPYVFDGKEFISMDIDGILITPEIKIESIEFFNKNGG